jgi:hypothetical protein
MVVLGTLLALPFTFACFLFASAVRAQGISALFPFGFVVFLVMGAAWYLAGAGVWTLVVRGTTWFASSTRMSVARARPIRRWWLTVNRMPLFR